MPATVSQSAFMRFLTAISIRATPQAKALANSNWFDSGRRFAVTPRAMRKTVCSAKAARNTSHDARSSFSLLKAVPENCSTTAAA